MVLWSTTDLTVTTEWTFGQLAHPHHSIISGLSKFRQWTVEMSKATYPLLTYVQLTGQLEHFATGQIVTAFEFGLKSGHLVRCEWNSRSATGTLASTTTAIGHKLLLTIISVTSCKCQLKNI